MNLKDLRIVSLFCVGGGFDLGFRQAGFPAPIFMNEYDKKVLPSLKKNFPEAEGVIDSRSITDIPPSEIPDCDLIMGSPPCQSWSAAGNREGINDERGKLFYSYIRLVRRKKPMAFILENVSGMLSKKHFPAFMTFIKMFEDLGYEVSYKEINAADYGVPQDRHRVFVVGIKNQSEGKLTIHRKFIFPKGNGHPTYTIGMALRTLPPPVPFPSPSSVNANQYLEKTYFSSRFLSRNRIRRKNEVSFTIIAQERQIPLHYSCPPMVKIGKDLWEFGKGKYRRYSVREAARLQTFPDSYTIEMESNIADGYKLIGNAVPPRLAMILARSLKEQLHLKE